MATTHSAIPPCHSSPDNLCQFYPNLEPVQYTNVIVKTVISQVLSTDLTWVINAHNNGTIKVRTGKVKPHLRQSKGKKEHNCSPFKLRTEMEEMYLRRSGNTDYDGTLF